MNLPFPHRLIVAFLNTLARLVLWSRQPFIIGVTGSVGKSSAKEAIAAVLGRHLSVRASVGNLNNEFGLPLAILGAKESPGRSPWKWLRLGAESILVILRLRPYPAHLVLEMGVDRPGDMERHVSVARPHLSVLTRIAESHLAAFGTVPNIAKEKRKILSALSENGIAVLNADDPLVMKQAEIVKGKILTYGVEAEADVRADNIRLIQEGARLEGLSFKLNYAGTTIPVRLPGVIGRHHIPAVLAAATVALALKLNLVDIAAALSLFRPLPGRFRLLSGEGDIRLIDDTYNASFVSTAAALATLRETIAPRKVVVLGDMLEIGEGARESHRALRDRERRHGFCRCGAVHAAFGRCAPLHDIPRESHLCFP
jgi:UDP-N-acetylmuramoyl-tripeptide--D-alanyl-D-alanine ligase